jgi:hypothetical protein
MPYDHLRCKCAGSLKWFQMVSNAPAICHSIFGKTVSPFLYARGHIMTLMCPGARRLGAGAPITVLQFAPLARLRPVLGFHALNCVCARFMNKGAFCRCRDNKLEGGTSRRPNFFVF